MIDIKKATQNDLEAFIELEREFKHYKNMFEMERTYKGISGRQLTKNHCKKDFLERLGKRNSIFCFAKEGNDYLGYIYGHLIKLPPTFKMKYVGYIDSIFIKSGYRKRKIASMLKDAFIEWLRTKRVTVCQISVTSKNRKALKIYQHWGFAIDEHRLYKKI